MEHIFSTRSNQFHLEQLTPIQKLYSIQGVLAYEDLIDRTMLLLAEHLEARFINGANAGKTCDMASWISYCKFCSLAVHYLPYNGGSIQEAKLNTASFFQFLGIS